MVYSIFFKVVKEKYSLGIEAWKKLFQGRHKGIIWDLADAIMFILFL